MYVTSRILSPLLDRVARSETHAEPRAKTADDGGATRSEVSYLRALLVAIGVAFAAVLVLEEIPRVLFPWDVRMFSEPAFLTNMVKLDHGLPTYSDPADANSYIYAPALEYITFTLLKPLGLHLDLRACRVISCLIGAGAAILAGRLVRGFAERFDKGSGGRSAALIGGALAGAMIFKSYTSDACHPDNLYIFHALLNVALTWAALATGRFEVALVAVAFGAVGITVKQTAALAPVGSTVVLILAHRHAWGRLRSLALVAVGVTVAALAALLLLRGWGHFWTFTVPSKASVESWRLNRLVLAYWTQMPYRGILVLAFPPSALYVALRAKSDLRLRRLFTAWAVVGGTEVGATLLSYFKIHGYYNNLTIIDIWMSLPVVGLLLFFARAAARPITENATPRGADLVHARRAVAGGLLLVLFFALMPTRVWPTHDEWAAGREIEAAIAADHAQGKRVTISMGTAFLLRSGIHEVPLDRYSSLAELETGGLAALGKTKDRFASRYYDKVYVVVAGRYGDDLMRTLEANYHELPTLHRMPLPVSDWDHVSNMYFLRDGVRVFEKNP